MAKDHPRYSNSHHWILARNLTRKEVHPRYFKKFRKLMFQIPTGVFLMADGTRVDVQKLVSIAERIGAAEDGMDKAQSALAAAQAKKDTAQADAAALIAKAAQDVTDAQQAQAQANGDYKSANADLLAFVQALDVPPPGPPAPAAPAAAS